MAKTLFGIVYGAVSKCVLRTIIPDDDAYLADLALRLRPGEALATAPIATVNNGQFFVENTIPAILAAGGPQLVPPIRSVIVDANGNVVDVLMADPNLYSPPQAASSHMTDALAALGLQVPVTPTPPFSIVAHDTASVGGRLVGGVYTAPVAAKGKAPTI